MTSSMSTPSRPASCSATEEHARALEDTVAPADSVVREIHKLRAGAGLLSRWDRR